MSTPHGTTANNTLLDNNQPWDVFPDRSTLTQIHTDQHLHKLPDSPQLKQIGIPLLSGHLN
jgi:hypothetical protein